MKKNSKIRVQTLRQTVLYFLFSFGNEAPGSHLQPGPTLAFGTMWKVKHQMKDWNSTRIATVI